MSDHDKSRRRPLSDFVRADEGYERLRAMVTSEAPPEAADLEIAPADGKQPTLALKAQPFPAYDSPSSRVVLLIGRAAEPTRGR
jgi:hypothetical protein